ncbi:MAG: hypothetical protein ACREIS_00595, partial [Nitrospiraceae bacterium]
LEAIRRKPIDLAISDYLMPGMDGVTFLKEVRRLYPAIQLNESRSRVSPRRGVLVASDPGL